ncbi:hypothetical protein GJAV_G00271640 [Gymnothorax javanicus]|nr:hypothetical protein GJAV_G00271640 [Gymnothorax javanicus]
MLTSYHPANDRLPLLRHPQPAMLVLASHASLHPSAPQLAGASTLYTPRKAEQTLMTINKNVWRLEPVQEALVRVSCFPDSSSGSRYAMAEVVNMIDSEVFLAFSTYATIVILKMMFMAPVTSYYRMTRKAFSNFEDTVHVKEAEERKKAVRTDPDVERVRRCHLNDIENVVPFVLIGLLYSLTGPDLHAALLYFRIFVVSRFCHTVCYLVPFPQPSRGLCFLAGVFVNVMMAYRVLTTGLHHL